MSSGKVTKKVEPSDDDLKIGFGISQDFDLGGMVKQVEDLKINTSSLPSKSLTTPVSEKSILKTPPLSFTPKGPKQTSASQPSPITLAAPGPKTGGKPKRYIKKDKKSKALDSVLSSVAPSVDIAIPPDDVATSKDFEEMSAFSQHITEEVGDLTLRVNVLEEQNDHLRSENARFLSYLTEFSKELSELREVVKKGQGVQPEATDSRKKAFINQNTQVAPPAKNTGGDVSSDASTTRVQSVAQVPNPPVGRRTIPSKKLNF